MVSVVEVHVFSDNIAELPVDGSNACEVLLVSICLGKQRARVIGLVFALNIA